MKFKIFISFHSGESLEIETSQFTITENCLVTSDGKAFFPLSHMSKSEYFSDVKEITIKTEKL